MVSQTLPARARRAFATRLLRFRTASWKHSPGQRQGSNPQGVPAAPVTGPQTAGTPWPQMAGVER